MSAAFPATICNENMHGILGRTGVTPSRDLFKALRQSCDSQWKQCFPPYLVDISLGHYGDVSETHYLMIPDDVWDRAATQSAVKPAAASSRTESQGLTNGNSDNHATRPEDHAKTGVFASYDTENAIGPGRIRTCDQAIMSRLL